MTLTHSKLPKLLQSYLPHSKSRSSHENPPTKEQNNKKSWRILHKKSLLHSQSNIQVVGVCKNPTGGTRSNSPKKLPIQPYQNQAKING